MKAGTLLKIIAGILNAFDAVGLIDADGNVLAPTPAQDAQLAVAVENVLKLHGVTIQEKVDHVIQALPLLMSVLA